MATAIHQYEDKLLDFAYGELPALEASAVESHLKSCPRCTEALDQIRGVRATMSALPQEPAPAAGLESLLAYAGQAAARNAAAPRPGMAWWRRMVAPLAGACALALVAVVAIKTQGELEPSTEQAVLDATARPEEKAAAAAELAPAPAPVAAAPRGEPAREALEPQKVAQRMKVGKVSGAAAAAESDRKAQEQRDWDGNKQDALAKNNEGYQQELGATRGPPTTERQQAQRQELGSNLKAAAKESRSRREADYGNARGGYVQSKLAEESGKKEQAAPSDEAAELTFAGDGSKDKTAQAAPLGLSAPKPSAPPSPAPTTQAAPPPRQVAANEPAAAQQPSSLGMSINTGPGTGSLGTRSSPSAYKQGSRDSLDDDTAGRGVNELADRKRLSNDVEAEQRGAELEARQHLEAARAAGNQRNHQEEVKQALAALATHVKGAPRAEALSRLCSALEELGNEGQADQYCDALLREFPTTTMAKVVANRRNNLQRAKKPSAARALEADSEKKAEPAKAKAVDESKPASAY